MSSGYVYVLLCGDNRYYYGSTSNLVQRLAHHRSGRVRSTRSRLPVSLVYFEVCQTLDQAMQKEHALKNGRTRRKTIDQMVRTFPPELLAPFA